MPPNFELKLGFSPNDPSFFEIVFSPNASAFESVSLIHLILECTLECTPLKEKNGLKSGKKVREMGQNLGKNKQTNKPEEEGKSFFQFTLPLLAVGLAIYCIGKHIIYHSTF